MDIKTTLINHIINCDNYYEILGVNKNATKDEIEIRYKELSIVIHSDKCGHKDSEEAIKKLRKAYETLIDNQKKFDYNIRSKFHNSEANGIQQKHNSSGFAQTSRPETIDPKAIDAIKRIMSCDNYYKILGIESDANEEDIKTAYRRLALIIHPDKCGHKDSEEASKKVNKAYETLRDSRFTYDESVSNTRSRYRQRTSPQSSSFDTRERNNGHQRQRTSPRSSSFDTREQNQRQRTAYKPKTNNKDKSEDKPEDNTLLNRSAIIVFLIIVLIAVLVYKPKSSLPYSLYRTPKYFNLRKTSSYNLRYYVDDDFDDRFSIRRIQELEIQIENNHLNDLKQKCLEERRNPEYLELLKKARKLKDLRIEENAVKSKLPACVLLQKLPSY